MRLLLERLDDSGIQTIGGLFVLDEEDFSLADFPSLELPWKNNQRNISCIPTGIYKVIKHRSPKFGQSLWIQDVPGRSEILIHPANYFSDLRGCIAPGSDLSDLDKNGHIDVTSSRKAMNKILSLLPGTTTIEIVNGAHL